MSLCMGRNGKQKQFVLYLVQPLLAGFHFPFDARPLQFTSEHLLVNID